MLLRLRLLLLLLLLLLWLLLSLSLLLICFAIVVEVPSVVLCKAISRALRFRRKYGARRRSGRVGYVVRWTDCGEADLVETESTSTSIYKCFKAPKTCRDGGNIDLRVNTRHEHFDSHVFQGSQDVPNAGWLSGCGDVGLRVNRGHEHFDSHVFQSR